MDLRRLQKMVQEFEAHRKFVDKTELAVASEDGM